VSYSGKRREPGSGRRRTAVDPNTRRQRMATVEHDHEYTHAGEKVRLGVHRRGVAREPRVRWRVGEQRGERGYVHRNAPEPVIRLEAGETIRLGERLVAAIPVPHEVADELAAACEALGTVVAAGDRIGDDPAAFPAAIDGFERVGWEPARNVMWYWRDERTAPRAYQIERGDLVFRAREWAEESCSRAGLIERYDLDVPAGTVEGEPSADAARFE